MCDTRPLHARIRGLGVLAAPRLADPTYLSFSLCEYLIRTPSPSPVLARLSLSLIVRSILGTATTELLSLPKPCRSRSTPRAPKYFEACITSHRWACPLTLAAGSSLLSMYISYRICDPGLRQATVGALHHNSPSTTSLSIFLLAVLPDPRQPTPDVEILPLLVNGRRSSG